VRSESVDIYDLDMTKEIENDIRKKRLVLSERAKQRKERYASTLHPDDVWEIDDETRAIIYAQPLSRDERE